ncbi:MAG: ImmA/IrrE family metallo-endopeptidase [Oscillospiraceae bacterium]|jgi:hypothetical protein|nr:ImmA/IrrE family metallo-endopeptidase [Oscillospiraceae bacterium]
MTTGFLRRENYGDAARELLLTQDTASFSPDVSEMRFDGKIYFDTFQNYSKLTGVPLKALLPSPCFRDGYTVAYNGVFLILTDARSSYKPNAHRSTNAVNPENKRLNWTLAHEVGHIVLGHRGDGEAEEREANGFAAELLMPEPVISALASGLNKGITAVEISRLFNVSMKAACSRIAALSGKRRLSPYLRRELLEKYRVPIEAYLKRANRFYPRERALIP